MHTLLLSILASLFNHQTSLPEFGGWSITPLAAQLHSLELNKGVASGGLHWPADCAPQGFSSGTWC